MKKIEAVLRTSEFWVFLAQVVIQAISVPVPEDVKAAAWVYIAARVISKVVKYTPPPKAVPAILLGLLIAGHASASVSELDASKRLSGTINGGAIVVTGPQSWSGASAGGTLLYNLHPNLSLFGGYDHGFPIKSTAPHLDLFRAVASIRVLPDAFVGFGYAWFDGRSDGALAQLVLTHQIMPRVAVGGMYAHILTRTDDPDFEYVRAYLNYHLFGKE